MLRFLVLNQLREALRRERGDHIPSLKEPLFSVWSLDANVPAGPVHLALKLSHAMTQQQSSSITLQASCNPFTENLHGPVKVPKPERGLDHLQYRCAIERGGLISGFLGIESKLQIQKAS